MTMREFADIQARYAHGASWSVAGVRVTVDVNDYRRVFGRTDALVSPRAGAGEVWVSVDALTPTSIDGSN